MKRSRARRNARRRAPGPRLKLLRSLRMWMAIAWLGTFAVIAYGLHELEPYAQRTNTSDTAVEWVGVPGWLRDANWKHVLPQLEARIDLHPRTDPYHDSVCSYVAARLAGSAWVDRVRRVTKQTDGRVKVWADFRKPSAMVERDGVAYLVDELGVRLPEQWAVSGLNRAGWFAIRGVSAAVPRPGKRWGGEDLTAGLKLARFLYQTKSSGQLPFRGSIRAIDVSNYRGKKDPRGGRLQLVTINPQSYIHWGLPPGEEYDIESSAELKLAMLRKLYAVEGRLPDQGPIDVRGDDGIGLGGPD